MYCGGAVVIYTAAGGGGRHEHVTEGQDRTGEREGGWRQVEVPPGCLRGCSVGGGRCPVPWSLPLSHCTVGHCRALLIAGCPPEMGHNKLASLGHHSFTRRSQSHCGYDQVPTTRDIGSQKGCRRFSLVVRIVASLYAQGFSGGFQCCTLNLPATDWGRWYSVFDHWWSATAVFHRLTASGWHLLPFWSSGQSSVAARWTPGARVLEGLAVAGDSLVEWVCMLSALAGRWENVHATGKTLVSHYLLNGRPVTLRVTVPDH